MTPFAQSVVGFVRQHALFSGGARVLVALSGGPDSCALLLSLLEASEERLLPCPVAAAHFHHGVRGRDADADAAFCAALCTRYGLPLLIGLGAVPTSGGGYSSATARRMRYAFLQEAAEDYKADTLVTAHNADDQAETVIGRVLRGTSVDGVAGIPVRRQLSDSVTVVRPLLGMRRRDIESYCTLRQIIPRHDPSNDKERYTRTRLRKILPQLAESFNPRVWDALNRLSEHASVDSELLTRLTADVTASVVRRRTPQEIRLDREGLIDAHPALRRRVILAMIQQITGKAAEKAATWEWVLAVESILTETGTILTLPGAIRVTVQGGELVFLRVPPQPRPESTPIPVLVPGMTFAESYGLALNSVVTFDAREPFRERKSLKIEVAADESDAVSSALELRALKPGERIHPLGFSNHSRLVRDILAEAKVPVERRGVFPVVARADTGEILWVIGICQTEATRITSATRRRIRFEAVFDLAPSLGHSEKT